MDDPIDKYVLKIRLKSPSLSVLELFFVEIFLRLCTCQCDF